MLKVLPSWVAGLQEAQASRALLAEVAQALGQRQAETQAAQQLVERVLVHLKEAKTVRQVQELQSLAAPWVQEPEQAMLVAVSAMRSRPTMPAIFISATCAAPRPASTKSPSTARKQNSATKS